ncbi:MAG TPA: sialate O-acetylesterase [Sphingomonas sp.]|nr:sialate O-acetylesterase [Sphingomonas sp.]
MFFRPASIVLPVLACVVAAPAAATPRLDGVLSDHAVVQRGVPIVLNGDAVPGEAVLVSMAGHTVVAKAGRDGRFEARLPAMPAGGPYDLTIAAPSGGAVIRDLLLGDVFLCSGQSNMEMAVDRTQDLIPDANPLPDDQLRLLTVAKAAATTPLARFATAPQWTPAGPASVPSFSAACFYMAQSLRRTAKVPIGAIHASWGGSRISAWMSDAALRRAGLSDDADQIALYARDPAAASRNASASWERWWRRDTGDAAGAEPWQPAADSAWRDVPRIDNFESWGVPELADYNGMLWFRREVTLSAAQASGPAILALGAIDDADRTWVNGRGVGGTSRAGQPRVYALAAGTLKPGRNVIIVNVDDGYALGGMTGPAETMRLTFADGSSAAIATGWQFAIAKRPATGAPRVAWDDISGAGTLFNAMIAPLGRMPLAGIAWYQGESDTGLPGYDRRLAAMIADWRQRLGSATAAFAVVQLANYGGPASEPRESGWATVRDAQRRVTAADPHGGLAISLDLGDARDIHPAQKLEVGRRLAQVMRARVYGEAVAPAGPAIEAARRNPDGGVTLRFTGVAGALHPQSAATAIGFEYCDVAPGSCRYAAGKAAGAEVVLAGDGRPASRVRYAWADAPATNLVDDARLPVGTFEIDVAPATGGAQ